MCKITRSFLLLVTLATQNHNLMAAESAVIYGYSRSGPTSAEAVCRSFSPKDSELLAYPNAKISKLTNFEILAACNLKVDWSGTSLNIDAGVSDFCSPINNFGESVSLGLVRSNPLIKCLSSDCRNNDTTPSARCSLNEYCTKNIDRYYNVVHRTTVETVSKHYSNITTCLDNSSTDVSNLAPSLLAVRDNLDALIALGTEGCVAMFGTKSKFMLVEYELEHFNAHVCKQSSLQLWHTSIDGQIAGLGYCNIPCENQIQ